MGLEQPRKPTHKIVDIRHMRQHVVGHHQVGLQAVGRQFFGQCHAKKPFHHRDALGACRCRRAGGRLHAVARDACSLHVLQQVAVVRGHFDHAAGRGKAQAHSHRLHIGLGVGEPGR